MCLWHVFGFRNKTETFDGNGRKQKCWTKHLTMKIFYTILAASMLSNLASAKTYTIGSGKWTDTKIWNNEYPGTTIKADDIVIISGQVTMNAGIIVEGILTVEKGACMIGMKDLVISKSGKFVNNGNTVMGRIVNEGSIDNNLIMEAMMDIDNKGNIENNNNMVAGNNFDNFGGHANGNGGAYFIDNSVYTSPSSDFGKDVKVFQGDAIKKSEGVIPSVSPFILSAVFNADKGVMLCVSNVGGKDVASFDIEKSIDRKNFVHIETIKATSANNKIAMSYTDNDVNSNFTYYLVKVINCKGEETALPIATVKTPGYKKAYTLVTE